MIQRIITGYPRGVSDRSTQYIPLHTNIKTESKRSPFSFIGK